VSTKRPFRVSRGVVRDRQQPGKDRVAVNPDLISSSPSLEKDDARQIFCRRPGAGQTKAVVIYGLRVAFEEFSERGTIMGAYLRPEVTVGFADKNHSHDYLMSGKP